MIRVWDRSVARICLRILKFNFLDEGGEVVVCGYITAP